MLIKRVAERDYHSAILNMSQGDIAEVSDVEGTRLMTDFPGDWAPAEESEKPTVVAPSAKLMKGEFMCPECKDRMFGDEKAFKRHLARHASIQNQARGIFKRRK